MGYTVDRERWAKFTIFEQLGNIGSEVGRTFNAKKSSADYTPAMYRAIDLFDATVDDLLIKQPNRLKEVLRAKDQYLEVALDPSATNVAMNGIEKYFMHFALTARMHI